MSYVKGEAPGQGSLFPVFLDELIPTDHLVRVIEAYVARLDMAALGFAKAVTKAALRSRRSAQALSVRLFAPHSLFAPAGSQMPAQC